VSSGEDYKRKMLLWMVFMKLFKFNNKGRWIWDPQANRGRGKEMWIE